MEEAAAAAEGVPVPDARTGVEASTRYGGMSIRQCVDKINKSLDHPKVRFLREHMIDAGCPVWVRLIMALNCKDQGFAGGYGSGKGIAICCNHMTFQDEINQVLIHELIHAYDDCRAKNIDWKNCYHHACSEIRANHLSGDCHYKRELLRGFMKIRGHEQECVKRRALKSVQVNPHCSDAAAKDAVEAVWDICYNDTYPFERAP
ncbi:unnamed protein product [Musa textilis]